MTSKVTIVELISTVSEFARNEAELVATVVWMVNSGSVQLRGSLDGARFDMAARGAERAATA